MARQRSDQGRSPRRPQQTCWQWMYACVWEDESGHHVYFKAHAVVINSDTNYQLASSMARREVLSNLTESERELIAEHPNASFHCRRMGRIIEVPGPC